MAAVLNGSAGGGMRCPRQVHSATPLADRQTQRPTARLRQASAKWSILLASAEVACFPHDRSAGICETHFESGAAGRSQFRLSTRTPGPLKLASTESFT